MSDKIKILQITVRADFGGGPEHLYQLLDMDNKIEFFIAAPDDEPYFKKYQEKLGSKRIVKIPHRKFTIKAFFQLVRIIKKNRISIIHSHGKGAGVYSRLLAIFTGKKCIHTFHGVHLMNYNGLSRFVYKIIERFLAVFTSRFIVVSKSEKGKVLKNHFANEKKIVLIENGIRIPNKPDLNQNRFESNKIIHISRFDYAKNSMLMYDIVSEFNKRMSARKYEFIFIGEGEDSILLRNKFEDSQITNVKFIGFSNELDKFYKDSFCFISTSRWEGLPLTVLEAMSYGLPVVATDVDGNNDIIKDNETGFLYELDQPEKAVAQIIKLCENSSLYSSISQNCRSVVEENYDRKNMIKETEDLYLSLL